MKENKAMSGNGEEVKFVVDTMLGDLARWLRILGYDTKYSRDYEDWQLLRIAENESRILVTRDRGLYWRARRRGISTILVEANDIAGRLYTVAIRYPIRLYVDFSLTRCSICNTPLMKVDKDKIRGKVPEPVYDKYHDFWICPKCGKVYWRGRHWIKIEEILRQVRGMVDEWKRTCSPKRIKL